MARPPVAMFIVIRPGVEVKPVECNALLPNGDLGEIGANGRVESIPVHTEVCGGIPQTNQTWQDIGR